MSAVVNTMSLLLFFGLLMWRILTSCSFSQLLPVGPAAVKCFGLLGTSWFVSGHHMC